MRAVVLSHMYPSDVAPMYGSFVHNQVRFTQQHVDMTVVSPVAWWPFPGAGRWSANRALPQHEVLDGIAVSRPRYACVPRRHLPGWSWRAFGRSVRPFLQTGPDLIHAHAAYPDGLAAIELGRRFGLKVVLTVHGSDVKTLPKLGPAWKRRVQAALTGADGVITVSDELTQSVADAGVPAERIEQIPNGVDGELFRGQIRRRAGEQGWRLLYVGRFDPAKGLHDLLQAMALLRQHRTDITLDLIGGHPHSGPAAPFVEAANRLGLQQIVRFHDAIPIQQIPERLALADVFVLPSHSEGLPLSLLEALASGLPVVATRCGGPTQLVTPATGRLADIRDPAGLAQAIGSVLDEYATFDREAIRARTIGDYDYRHVAARLHAFYERVVDSGRDGRS